MAWFDRTLLATLCALTLLTLLGGCASTRSGAAAHPYWPKQPDPARFIYESAIRTELDITLETRGDAFRNAVAGTNPRAASAFKKPYDIAARNGRILVSDSGGEIVHLFDLPQGKLIRIGRGDKAKLQQPSGVTIDHQNNFYVADIKNKTVNVYDPVGHFVRFLGDKEVFAKPADVAVSKSGDRIYVVDLGGIDSDKHRVTVFDPQGTVLFTFGKHGSALGDFHLASHIEIGPDGNVYVLDAGNFRVQVFDRDGKYLRSWGKAGVNIGDMARPRGLALDTEGNVYITDGTFGNLQIFNPEGQLLMWIGNTGQEDKPGQYALPAGIAIDEANHVYVVDQLYTKVEVLRRLNQEESDRLAKNLPLNTRAKGPSMSLISAKAPAPVRNTPPAAPTATPPVPVEPALTPTPISTPIPTPTPDPAPVAP
jgi:sugar lactone lactonase YvrE